MLEEQLRENKDDEALESVTGKRVFEGSFIGLGK